MGLSPLHEAILKVLRENPGTAFDARILAMTIQGKGSPYDADVTKIRQAMLFLERKGLIFRVPYPGYLTIKLVSIKPPESLDDLLSLRLQTVETWREGAANKGES